MKRQDEDIQVSKGGKIMEQRILQYRKSIDAWLEKMERNAQTQEDGNTEGITRTEEQKADEREQIVRDKLEEHLVQIGFFQHERLVHLIVTVTFALLEMLAIILSVIADSLFSIILPVVILILLIPYIRHYYILENEVQKMYVQYDRMIELLQHMKKRIEK